MDDALAFVPVLPVEAPLAVVPVLPVDVVELVPPDDALAVEPLLPLPLLDAALAVLPELDPPLEPKLLEEPVAAAGQQLGGTAMTPCGRPWHAA